jgi:hypothetical protein
LDTGSPGIFFTKFRKNILTHLTIPFLTPAGYGNSTHLSTVSNSFNRTGLYAWQIPLGVLRVIVRKIIIPARILSTNLSWRAGLEKVGQLADGSKLI